jgi:hypothetical protein
MAVDSGSSFAGVMGGSYAIGLGLARQIAELCGHRRVRGVAPKDQVVAGSVRPNRRSLVTRY